MIPVAAQIVGIAFACGLNLYVTVAALGILSRLNLIGRLPPGLVGLESLIVIGSALTLYVIEAIVDKVPHADSLWDTVHTFIRPPAAALLAVGILWGAPPTVMVGGAAAAFVIALAAHGGKAGFRLALNTGPRDLRPAWISVSEDVAAVAFATAAFTFPLAALVAAGAALVALLIVGPRLWRAFVLGMRCLTASLRAFFGPGRWREERELPGDLRALLDKQPLGSAPPRGTRVGLHGAPGVGAYRNGWLLITPAGPVFAYRTLLGARRFDLPMAHAVDLDRGAWADLVRMSNGRESTLTLYLLKDGPTPELAVSELRPGAP